MKFEFRSELHRVAVGFPLAGDMRSAPVSELEIRVALRRAGKALVNMTVVRRLEKSRETTAGISDQLVTTILVRLRPYGSEIAFSVTVRFWWKFVWEKGGRRFRLVDSARNCGTLRLVKSVYQKNQLLPRAANIHLREHKSLEISLAAFATIRRRYLLPFPTVPRSQSHFTK